MRVSLLLPMLLLLPACYASPLPQQTTSAALAFSEFAMVKLKLGDKLIEVQLADSPARRSQGLMGQSPLHHGMLLLQDEVKPVVLWMKNTPEPLDVAFISADWTIVSIQQMQAYSETRHSSVGPVIAALEMPLGWFAKQNIQLGSKVLYCQDQPNSCQGQAQPF